MRGGGTENFQKNTPSEDQLLVNVLVVGTVLRKQDQVLHLPPCYKSISDFIEKTTKEETKIPYTFKAMAVTPTHQIIQVPG